VHYGAHLPLIDLDGRGWDAGRLTGYVRTARDLGFHAIAANDHLTFPRPWLDGLIGLASVIEASGELRLVTTAALPVIRGAAVLAATATALDALSAGRLELGVAPGSSPADYRLAGIAFAERWQRFDDAVDVLRRHRPGRPIWVASWGSQQGLRRVARLGDGWLASAYNTGPDQVAAGRARLHLERSRLGRPDTELPCTVATMWTLITDSDAERGAALDRLAQLLDRPRQLLAERVLVGSVEHCSALVRAYAEAGVELLCLWPLGDGERQLERFIRDVVPRI
jgi:alkanesulfonate monooxygenase SsuD/methylene tetrahydromethanopterin reductase-like flavin-dependent oxidoreductase (luciferase family)